MFTPKLSRRGEASDSGSLSFAPTAGPLDTPTNFSPGLVAAAAVAVKIPSRSWSRPNTGSRSHGDFVAPLNSNGDFYAT
jgi:hypothetical protein